jgi:hypothetical protein
MTAATSSAGEELQAPPTVIECGHRSPADDHAGALDLRRLDTQSAHHPVLLFDLGDRLLPRLQPGVAQTAAEAASIRITTWGD